MDGDRKSRRGTLHERQFLTVGSSVGLRGCAASVCLAFALDLGKGTGLSRARGSDLGFESVWAKACGLRMGSGLTCLESVGDRDALSGLGGNRFALGNLPLQVWTLLGANYTLYAIGSHPNPPRAVYSNTGKYSWLLIQWILESQPVGSLQRFAHCCPCVGKVLAQGSG